MMNDVTIYAEIVDLPGQGGGVRGQVIGMEPTSVIGGPGGLSGGGSYRVQPVDVQFRINGLASQSEEIVLARRVNLVDENKSRALDEARSLVVRELHELARLIHQGTFPDLD